LLTSEQTVVKKVPSATGGRGKVTNLVLQSEAADAV